ncbi:MAG: diguanylate cyclase domain-containing protein [Cellulomonas sp.]
MRADQVSLSNAVWSQREPEAMLALTGAMARATLDYPGLTGSVRRLPRGSHAVGLYPHPAGAHDALDAQLHDAHAQADELRSPLTVISCDIDDVKKVNDEHGHRRGDTILVEAAGRFGEIVCETAYIARFGGDEFVVVLPDAGTDAEILDVARRVRTSLAPGRGGTSGAPSLSVGVALWTPGKDRDPVRLLRDVDAAMYGAKAGRDGVLMFDQSLRARLPTEIEAHFQPVVDGMTREVQSYEALAQWRQGDSLRMPGTWLPVAARSGLILGIDLEMIRQARRHGDETGLPVAGNVSPEAAHGAVVRGGRHARPGVRRLGPPDPRDHRERARRGPPPSGGPTRAAARAGRPRGAGRRRHRLQRDRPAWGLPIDVLKIDRAFVVEVLTPRGQAVFRAILALADAYDLDVIAEGVEREEELATLVRLGSVEIQGYLAGRPAPSVSACEETA